MKREKIAQALNELSDHHIKEAVRSRKRSPWIAAVAAVLVLAIGVGVFWNPGNVPGSNPSPTPIDPGIQLEFLVAKPQYPKMAVYPLNYEADAYHAWHEDQKKMHSQPEGYADSLDGYFAAITQSLLTENGGGNAVCSPVNIYMALAMLAETTDGQSRQQILDLIGADNMESLRTQAQHVWEGHYNNDGLSTSILANSLWLEEGYVYNKETVQLLADSYYASVFQGDLGSEQMNQALRAWLNEQTGGLLEEQAQDLSLSPVSVLALASTLYYKVQWLDKFQEKRNTEGTFHAVSGDTDVTFMNHQLSYGPYYWSEHFGAVNLPLEDGSKMWLLLPDEGFTPEDILKSGEVMDFFAQDPAGYESPFQNKKSIIVNLTLPKFDICGDMELSDQLKALGVTDIFGAEKADFSPIIPVDDGGYISQVKHASRVAIDEEGVTAAAFTVIDRAGNAMPPEDEIDFVLDKPFLFMIESDDGLPLFCGIVNEP